MTVRFSALMAIAGFCLIATACGTSDATAPTPSPTAAGASAVPATGSSSPTPTLRPGQVEALPLDVLSTGAATLARELGRSIGIAVYVPSQQRIYQYNAEPEFPMASVVKLPIMLTVMDRAIADGRTITDAEESLITAMITESDNDATTELWNMIGGSVAVTAFLERAGIVGATIDAKDWGESDMSPVAGARLTGKLLTGEILDEDHRAFALELLTHIDPSQDWGAVVAGAWEGQAGVKNGWYPEYEGWVLASVGYVIPEDDRPQFSIAIFTDDWDSFGEGVAKLESIAGLLNNAVLAE